MATFTCDFCGKCCLSFGSFITIERQLSDRDYYCRYSLTGALYPVHVDAEYADDVSERYAENPVVGQRCPFLSQSRSGDGVACAIYPSRPTVCREFRCYRMLIYDGNGNIAGKVIGAGGISTSDEVLARLWKEEIVLIPHAHPPGANDPSWVKKITAILAAQGYRGEAVE